MKRIQKTVRKNCARGALLPVCFLLLIVSVPVLRADGPLPDVPFGMARSFDFYAEAQEMGVKWERMRVFWKHVEPAPDEWHWNTVDGGIDNLALYGIETVLLVRLGELDWATESNIYGDIYDNGSYLPLDLSDEWNEEYGYSETYYDFIHHLVSHICGRVSIMVIENEGNSLKFFYGEWNDYLKILLTAYKAAHDACGGIIVTNSGLASGLFGWCIAQDMMESGEYSDEEICDFATQYYRRCSLHGSYNFNGPNGMEQLLYRFEQNAREIEFADSTIMNMGGMVDAYNFHFYEDYEFIDDVTAWIDAKSAQGGYTVPMKISNEMGIRNRNEEYDRESLEHAQDVIKKMIQAIRCDLTLFCWFPMSDGYTAPERWQLTSDKIGLGDGYPRDEGGEFIERYASQAYTFVAGTIGAEPEFVGDRSEAENIVHWEFQITSGDASGRLVTLWWDDGCGGQGSETYQLSVPREGPEIIVRRFPDVDLRVDPGELDGTLPLEVDVSPLFVFFPEPTSAGGGDPADGGMPRSVRLDQNYPNPFNPHTTISFTISENHGAGSRVCLAIHDARGRLVNTLLERELSPGTHSAVWDGTDEQGVPVTSGVYFSRLRTGTECHVRKMLLMR